MTISNFDLTCLAFLDLIDSGAEFPDGCDIDLLAARGWVTQTPTGWSLTRMGEQRLRMLRSANDDPNP